jgi:hypothetical protein
MFRSYLGRFHFIIYPYIGPDTFREDIVQSRISYTSTDDPEWKDASLRIKALCNVRSWLSLISNIPNLHLSLSIALREDLLQSRLEDTDIVVNDGFLLRWIILAHDTYQCEISADLVSSALPHPSECRTYLLISRK